jgi:Aminoglycoside-2''-adenylyltransferase
VLSGLADVSPSQTRSKRQADLDGGYFDYPADAFTVGVLGGVRVACLSKDQQIRFTEATNLARSTHTISNCYLSNVSSIILAI